MCMEEGMFLHLLSRSLDPSYLIDSHILRWSCILKSLNYFTRILKTEEALYIQKSPRNSDGPKFLRSLSI